VFLFERPIDTLTPAIDRGEGGGARGRFTFSPSPNQLELAHLNSFCCQLANLPLTSEPINPLRRSEHHYHGLKNEQRTLHLRGFIVWNTSPPHQAAGPFFNVGILVVCRQYFQENSSLATGLLEHFARQKCYDPRDIIFATRSIVPALVSVVPDYSLCTADVFISATRAIITHDKNLDVLYHTSRKTPSRRK
jgi:hypothetical protein